jgi:glycosyltransferase involved in cell wall biosynthesis
VAPRVLHVVATAQRRGAEVFAADLVAALPEVDQQVAVLRGPWEIEFGARTTRLPPGPAVPGLRVHPAAIRALRSLVGLWRPDVIQAHGGEPFKHAVPAARGTPVVYRRIGWADPRAARGARRAVYAVLMRRAARVIAVAEAVRAETVETFGVPGDRVATIPVGVDPSRVQPLAGRAATRRGLRIPPDAPVVLSLGSLTPEKDPLGHLEVVNRARKRVQGIAHLMVGGGPLRPDVERAAGPATGGVLVLGSRADVGDLYAASDVVLLASRSEGMPAVVIEAGMAGLPVAAYGVAGVPEVVGDGVTGLVATPGDAEALSGHLARLLSDPALRRSLGRAARERCLAENEIGIVAGRYAELYRSLAGRSTRAGR